MQKYLMYSVSQDTQWLTTYVPFVIEEKQQLYSMLEELKGNKSKHVFLLMSHITGFKLSKEV